MSSTTKTEKILIFAGTTEGRILAEKLGECCVYCDVSVATEYGSLLIEENEYIHVINGRLEINDMKKLYESNSYSLIVDATHPFAQLVSENIKKSADDANIPVYRLSRNTDNLRNDNLTIHEAVSALDCANMLKKTTGKILLTTGSKELSVFCEDESLRDRLVVRVLPGIESIKLCNENKIEAKNVVAMQGPFSKELNQAIIRQFDIKHLVTKESGKTGGVGEKLSAADEAGIDVYLIKRPKETAYDRVYDLNEIFEIIVGSHALNEASNDTPNEMQNETPNLTANDGANVTLAGIGVGDNTYLTSNVIDAIKNAHIIFGANRMIESVSQYISADAEKYPYYMAKDIMPVLEEIINSKNTYSNRAKDVVVLFSGDSGFYSGARSFCAEFSKLCAGLSKLRNEANCANQNINISDSANRNINNIANLGNSVNKDINNSVNPENSINTEIKNNAIKFTVLPGISSIQALASKLKTNWEDANIISTHGVDKQLWANKIMSSVIQNKKTFFIASGLSDVKEVAQMILKYCEDNRHLDICLKLGYNISYDDEKIFSYSTCNESDDVSKATWIDDSKIISQDLSEIENLTDEGLYCGVIINKQPDKQIVTPGISDEDFLRGSTPMTKEEIREIAICKLGLKCDSIVYDIGSGTGSVTVECAKMSPDIRVYAIESDDGAYALTRQNAMAFNLYNVTQVHALAPDGMDKLPLPDCVFIGGSKGNLRSILKVIEQKKNDEVNDACKSNGEVDINNRNSQRNIRVVITAITLETVSEIIDIIHEMNIKAEITQVAVSKARQAGEYNLMQAQNAVYIFKLDL